MVLRWLHEYAFGWSCRISYLAPEAQGFRLGRCRFISLAIGLNQHQSQSDDHEYGSHQLHAA